MEKLLRQRRRLPKKGGVRTDDRYAMSCFGTRRIPEESYRIQVTGAAALQPRSSLRGSFHPFPLADEKIIVPVRCGSRRTGRQHRRNYAGCFSTRTAAVSVILQICCRQTGRIVERLPNRETAVCRVSPDFDLRGFSTVPEAGRQADFILYQNRRNIRAGETGGKESLNGKNKAEYEVCGRSPDGADDGVRDDSGIVCSDGFTGSNSFFCNNL